MSNDSLKRDQDDILYLVDELAEIKAVLKDASQQLLRIERRVKATLPRAPRANGGSARPRSRARTPIDDQTARRIIDELKDSVAKGASIERRLSEFVVKPELQSIAKVLGMTNTKLPPKDELIRRISTRLRQGVSVAAGIHD